MYLCCCIDSLKRCRKQTDSRGNVNDHAPFPAESAAIEECTGICLELTFPPSLGGGCVSSVSRKEEEDEEEEEEEERGREREQHNNNYYVRWETERERWREGERIR